MNSSLLADQMGSVVLHLSLIAICLQDRLTVIARPRSNHGSFDSPSFGSRLCAGTSSNKQSISISRRPNFSRQGFGGELRPRYVHCHVASRLTADRTVLEPVVQPLGHLTLVFDLLWRSRSGTAVMPLAVITLFYAAEAARARDGDVHAAT